MSKPVLEDLFTFYGRRNRKSAILFGAITLIASIAITSLFVNLFLLLATYEDAIILLVVFVVVSIIWSFCSIAVLAQRFHDIGWSGWSVLLFIIPGIISGFSPFLYFIEIVLLAGWIILLCVPGNRGENKYGPDPLGKREGRV